VKVIAIDESLIGKTVLVRARVHNSKLQGNLIFLTLREQFSTIQVVAQKTDVISKLMIQWLGKIPNESIVDITG
jgi:aspartyl-tRNA synthetase